MRVFSAEARNWLKEYRGIIDSTALLMAYDAGRDQGDSEGFSRGYDHGADNA